MAFRASNTIPENAFNRAKSAALHLKNYCAQKSATIQSSGMDANNLLGILATLKQSSADIAELKATPGIAQYAKDQENDQAYDVAAEFLALENLVNSAITNLAAAFPVDGSGYLLILKLQGSDKDWRQFTAVQLSAIQSDLDAIVAAVA